MKLIFENNELIEIEEKKIDYAFYDDVYAKKQKNTEKRRKDLEYANSLLDYEITEQFAYLSPYKKVCLEIEKQMHSYIKREPNTYVYINEERLRSVDGLIDFLFKIKEEIEHRHFNKVREVA
jgi:hypothetical protein